MGMNIPVIIIGAGPAGCAAAITLGKLGVKHMLVEKRSFTREKICAGGLTYKTIKILESLGLSKDAYKPHKLSMFEVYDGTKTIYKRKLKFPFYTADRSVLDSALYKLSIGENSVNPMDCANVQKLDYTKHEVVIDEQTFGYEYLILADGCNGYGSILAGIKKKNLFLHCKVPNNVPQKTIKVFFNCIDGEFGYGYVFPHDGFSFAGVGNTYDKTMDYKAELKSFCDNIGVPFDSANVKGALIPTWNKIDFDKIPRRVLVVGDAIGHASPLQGEGIPYALAGGIAAAKSIAYSLDNPDDAHNSYKAYHNKVTATLKRHQRVMRVAALSKKGLSKILKICGNHPNFLQICLEDGMFNGSFEITDMRTAIRWYRKHK